MRNKKKTIKNCGLIILFKIWFLYNSISQLHLKKKTKQKQNSFNKILY